MDAFIGIIGKCLEDDGLFLANYWKLASCDAHCFQVYFDMNDPNKGCIVVMSHDDFSGKISREVADLILSHCKDFALRAGWSFPATNTTAETTATNATTTYVSPNEVVSEEKSSSDPTCDCGNPHPHVPNGINCRRQWP